ncbi:glycosyltransferase [Actinoplanes sp. G11-F43]|uniref:glycosyltransferase n=1 Tax=Actinoplanes sp. G11-F43 TaxID=3424130 RepID=UPI003D3418DB
MSPVIVLIPAYQPDERLVTLVSHLNHHRVLVVDDGSGPAYTTTFEAARRTGAEVIHLSRNRGKGFALKTGFAHIRTHHPGHNVICADSDGQHRPEDIEAVAARLPTSSPTPRPATATISPSCSPTTSHTAPTTSPSCSPTTSHTAPTTSPSCSPTTSRTISATSRVSSAGASPVAMVLGVRRFTGRVPARSRFGNAATRIAFRLITGMAVTDTQTGLRGYPAHILPWLEAVPGDRFEYELRLLLNAARENLPVEEVDIATVYLDGNSSSHFRPVVDSARIYGPLLAFAASSLLAFTVDAAVLAALVTWTGDLTLSAIGARLVSATLNYTVNRTAVFSTRSPAAAFPSSPGPLSSPAASSPPYSRFPLSSFVPHLSSSVPESRLPSSASHLSSPGSRPPSSASHLSSSVYRPPSTGACLSSSASRFPSSECRLSSSSVGRGRVPHRRSAPRYIALALALLTANIALLHVLTALTGSLVISKVLTEVTLFLAGFAVQRTFVFRSPRPGPPGTRITPEAQPAGTHG